jgi:NAD+ kinase
MLVKDCVIVAKQTALAAGGRAAIFARRGDATAHRIKHADAEHRLTRETVVNTIRNRGLRVAEYSLIELDAAARRHLSRADLVITIGGDGTVLGTSHYVTMGTMLGVNSAPGDSIGFFCTANRLNFETVLDKILSGRRRPIALARLAIRLNGKLVPEPALNDVLIVHSCPAATTRYLIGTDDLLEEHRSSGIWISTPIGSTAGIRSAGGKVMPLGSRRLQYLVRELYREPGRSYQMVRGYLRDEQQLVVASKMPEGELYIDGARTRYAFPFGVRAEIGLAKKDLKIFLERRKM